MFTSLKTTLALYKVAKFLDGYLCYTKVPKKIVILSNCDHHSVQTIQVICPGTTDEFENVAEINVWSNGCTAPSMMKVHKAQDFIDVLRKCDFETEDIFIYY